LTAPSGEPIVVVTDVAMAAAGVAMSVSPQTHQLPLYSGTPVALSMVPPAADR
jgi:hypothetical protein